MRHDGEEYKVSPYALYWNEDNYYMVGYLDKRGDIAVFRVDRLCNPQITEERAVRKPKNFNIADYGNKIFHMFGGEEIMVELECHDELMKYIVDLFGTNANTVKTGDDTFTAKVPVALSPTFFGWVFQFGEKMRIIGPEEAVMEFERMKKI